MKSINEVLKDFDLKKEIKKLYENWEDSNNNFYVEELGIFKCDGKYESFVNYRGQGIVEPLYNGRADLVIELKEKFDNVFDIYFAYDEEKGEYQKVNNFEQDFEDNINAIYNDVIEEIKDFEEDN